MRAFFKYVAIQIFAYFVEFSVFILLLLVSLSLLEANVIAKIMAAAVAFTFHRVFTFSSTGETKVISQLGKYSTALLLNIPTSSAILFFLSQHIPSNFLSKMIADALCLILSFYISKYFVFQGSIARKESPLDKDRFIK